MRRLLRMPSVVADDTVGTVIVFVHAFLQERRGQRLLPPAGR